MERIIKFKAKRLSNGKWVEGLPCKNYNDETCILVLCPKEGGENDWGFIPVDPSTVCQFTGLKDKNGKEIWEHDILTDTDDGTLGEVTFSCGAFVVDGWSLSEYEYNDEELDLAVVASKFDRKEEK